MSMGHIQDRKSGFEWCRRASTELEVNIFSHHDIIMNCYDNDCTSSLNTGMCMERAGTERLQVAHLAWPFDHNRVL